MTLSVPLRHRLAAICAAVAAAAVLAVPALAGQPTGEERDSGEQQRSSDQRSPTSGGPKLTVMSYNIHHGRGVDGQLDLKRIADVVEEEDTDVVALQEVDNHFGERSEFRDQAAELAEELDMEFAYGANLDFDPPEPGAPRRQYGNAILSKHRIRESDNHPLPRTSERNEQRGLLEALIKVRGVPFRLYNTHLQHNSAADRALQVDAILEETKEEAGPHALLGDLNARPEAPELARLFTNFRDAWAVAGEGDGFTISSSRPYARIDYALTSPDVGIEAARVPETLASDHLPVVAELRLRRPAPGHGRGDDRGDRKD
jgi:endonuclease/exonuclease/phosphatase family metal-dependent hydrolase